MAERRLKPHPQVVLTELNDGTAVLLHLETKFFFTLNETALCIWRNLRDGKTEADLCLALIQEFDVDRAAAERDVQALVAALMGESLLVDP